MKRTFVDLHLRPNPKDSDATLQLIKKTAALGYKVVAAPTDPQTSAGELQKLRHACKDAGLDFASRVDLHPKTPNELLSLLRRCRRKFEVICVLCENKEVARQAAKDRRVDLLNFPQIDYRERFFDAAEAELASSGLAALEFDAKPLLLLEGPARVRLLACLRREVQVARAFHVPIVVSSGVSDAMLLRKPREMAVLFSLVDLVGAYALDAVSCNPLSMVKRNRQKLSSKFVAPGIKVVKKGIDCEES
ncbi:MAG: RNase P subunit p30 family protein [Candidatus Bathyarchaeia archaeon]|jgi:RNase P/RNase MRP subunit p30